MSPSFQAAVRFIAVIGVEWSTLTLIKSAPVWVKIATFILAVAVLGTLEFRSWLQSRGKWAFATLLGGLIAVYLIVFALALFWTAPAWALFVTVFPWLLAAFGVLGIASGLYRAIAVEKALPSSVRLASAIDTQTRLDLIHLLDFAAMQASHAMLRRLIDLAFEPPIREAFGVGEHSQEAQESRQWYLGYVRQELAGSHRHSDFLNVLSGTQAEAERNVELDPESGAIPGETVLARRRRIIIELQFDRAIHFLHAQRRELEENMKARRSDLVGRLNLRQQQETVG